MKKSLKLFLRLSGSLAVGWLTGLTTVEAMAQSKPPPPPVKTPTYSFFQGLTFPPFPGTIPRSAYGGSSAPLFPLVEVPTPGIRTASEQSPTPTVRRRRKPRVENSEEPAQPVRRRRRSIPRPNDN